MPRIPPVLRLLKERTPCASTPSNTACVPVASSSPAKPRGLQATLGRSGSRVATPNPHRTALSGTDVHLPMVARADGHRREQYLRRANVSRKAVRFAGLRFHATRAPGTFLHECQAGTVALTTEAPGSAPAAAAQANGASRPTSRSAPCSSNDVGEQRGPSSLLFPRHPRYPLAICPPDL